MRLFKYIFFLILISCSQSKEEVKILSLSNKTEEHYSHFKNKKNVIGFSHYQTCDDESWKHLRCLRDSANKTELLWMLNDSCEKGFKVFLIEEIHKDFPEMDSLILSKYSSDTSEVIVVTSCLGIPDKFIFGKICSNIIANNSITLAVNALPPPPPLPPMLRECDSISKLAKEDYKNGKRQHTTLGYVPYSEFEEFYSDFMLKTYNIITKASCSIDFNDECYYNSMNREIEKEYGENFMDKSRKKAKIEFEKIKE
jgi:hypothetical protein